MKKEQEGFYKSTIEEHSKSLKELKKKLLFSSVLRLLIFLLICGGIYFFFGNTKLVLATIGIGIVLFLFLVSRHSNLQYSASLLRQLIAQNEIELEVLNFNFHQLPDGAKYRNPTHFYSEDIDLFGVGSFYQYSNRTALESGSDALAKMLLSNDIEGIEKKQRAVKELSAIPKWRQQFSAIASLVTIETSAATVHQWITNYKAFIPSWVPIVTTVFSVISGVLLGLYYFEFIPGLVPFFWFLLGLGISGIYVKKVNQLSAETSKVQSTFEQFNKLLLEIENVQFTSPLLVEKQLLVKEEQQKASALLKQFSKHLNALDQRSNMLIGVLLNGFMLRDLKQCYNIEKWIQNHSKNVVTWFEVISFFDAYNSLANYHFNHPQHTFPKLLKEGIVLESKASNHPLLNPEKAVSNNFSIKQDEFFIITGANMAGKSTFLRNVGLQIVMANVGLPICANEAKYTPIKLITSMRTTDNLTEDTSYFFGELKRLKLIVEAIKTERYFIILDEILKGTNSTDKAIGSRKFVEKLVRSNATGIIATHDLSLCEAANDFNEIENYYFDALIENDELHFDYTLKKGICQNMNASFLLKKMNIVD
ncbi:MAG: MutS-related protein [Patiriisocius sp.]|uniref:MutS-related protein n=1 Tax=Patiriisocius sp. TaxID=2822396 RepID=UPI003EFA2080